MGMNKTEIMALEWLIQRGYKRNEIIINSNTSPDFICMDGKRYEVKFLYGNKLIFSHVQSKILKNKDLILVFSRDNFVNEFLWGNRDKTPFEIKILPDSPFTKIQIDKELVNRLIKLKEMGDTYSDVIRRLLDK